MSIRPTRKRLRAAEQAWQSAPDTVYLDAALARLRADDYPVRDEDVARLSPYVRRQAVGKQTPAYRDFGSDVPHGPVLLVGQAAIHELGEVKASDLASDLDALGDHAIAGNRRRAAVERDGMALLHEDARRPEPAGYVGNARLLRCMTLDEARHAIGAYVDRYHHRPHSRLAYNMPREVAATWKDHDDRSIPAA